MPRVARGLVDGFIYHVLNRGNGGQQIFHKDQDYEVFISLMKEAKNRYPIKLFAYCMMPNHFHIVAMPIKAVDLSKWMQWLMTSHVRRYHCYYGTSGHIWQGRYKSFIVQQDNHLLTVLRYVEGNPVRAGLVPSAKLWLWSSHRERINRSHSAFVNEIPVELPEDWKQFVDEPLTEKELEKLNTSICRQTPYGDLLWQTKICQEVGLESTMRPRGRPKEKK